MARLHRSGRRAWRNSGGRFTGAKSNHSSSGLSTSIVSTNLKPPTFSKALAPTRIMAQHASKSLFFQMRGKSFPPAAGDACELATGDICQRDNRKAANVFCIMCIHRHCADLIGLLVRLWLGPTPPEFSTALSMRDTARSALRTIAHVLRV